MHPSPSLVRWMLDIFLEPAAAMRLLRDRPPLLAIYFASSILFASLSWTILSVNERAMARLLADGARPVLKEQSRQAIHREKLIRVVGAPMEIGLDASAAMIALIAGSWLNGRSPPFRSMIAAAIAAEAPQLLSLAIDLERLWNDGPEITLDLRPLVQCNTSLGAFVSLDARPPAVQSAAEEISPFTVWSSGLTGIAFRELGGASRKSAGVVSCAAWILRLAIAAARALAALELRRRGVF